MITLEQAKNLRLGDVLYLQTEKTNKVILKNGGLMEKFAEKKKLKICLILVGQF